MDNMDRWDPTNHKPVHTLPVQPTPLTSPPQRTIPALDDCRSERMQGRTVAGDPEVRGVTAYNGCQPASLVGDGVMKAPSHFHSDGRVPREANYGC
jgi:hypothetical protein